MKRYSTREVPASKHGITGYAIVHEVVYKGTKPLCFWINKSVADDMVREYYRIDREFKSYGIGFSGERKGRLKGVYEK